jgi:hypothetical protein
VGDTPIFRQDYDERAPLSDRSCLTPEPHLFRTVLLIMARTLYLLPETVSRKQTFTKHLREGKMPITWGPARFRSPLDERGADPEGGSARRKRPPKTLGPLSDFLRGPELESFAKCQDPLLGPDLDDSPLGHFVAAANRAIGPWDCRIWPSPELGLIAESWAALKPDVRRAAICIDILADRGCNQWVGSDHFLRPGGLYESDIGWLAGTSTRAQQQRVCSTLRDFGLVRTRKIPPGKSRYFNGDPTDPSRDPSLRRAGDRRELRTMGAELRRVTHGRPITRKREAWVRLLFGTDSGFLVGSSAPPEVISFIQTELQDLGRALIEARYGDHTSKHPRSEYRARQYSSWWHRECERLRSRDSSGRSPTPPYLILPLF